MVLALAEILRRAVEVQYDHNTVSYRPELYASAGGELLVVAMLLSWALTAVYRPDTIASNPLQDRVGYNNLCVGWDMAPARYVAAPLFGLIIWFENRYMMLDFWRASLTPGLSKVKENIVLVANFLNAVSWTFACLIFVIQADEWPAGHTAAFVQKVVFGYIAYVANFIETDESTHRTGSWVFLGLFGIVSSGFFCCAFVQFQFYDELTNTPGPIPWFVTAGFDYSWFACLVVQGFMRPRAPDIICALSLRLHDGSELSVLQAEVASVAGFGAVAKAAVTPPGSRPFAPLV
mmetsp:Transcript_143754/g.460127  ORF Transcript_143754/g.460127 Transcript_143754/m.460127 type:complete len:291 (-) Transcript_143754:47-919(-)|eukprot:CAMPEP_0203965804 /NCGR_PEP_ID=MMETSP0359-20131031/95206_1 /ASSEMBLY_ACC=CAM_ASM_000338 /TAXON_ID=268821 /ORGANISM="Scrippsiella Hangoei, Strain SHTV-5" /LENGTH=290 /DNA_ID=CAMNT_0050902893 /DNA_START=72 /DNA_END=944 /DNA_ORIENTATION=+